MVYCQGRTTGPISFFFFIEVIFPDEGLWLSSSCSNKEVFKTGLILGCIKPISFQNYILIIYPEFVSIETNEI